MTAKSTSERTVMGAQLYDALGYLDWLNWCGGKYKTDNDAAERFGVKQRTINRWKARLRDAGYLE